jgi:hypothetical protein
MKMISLSVIGLGVLCLIEAVVGRFTGHHLFTVDPIKYVHMASALFLLAVAVMCHCRFYGSSNEQK